MAKARAKAKTKAPSDIMGFMNYYLVDKAPMQLPKHVKKVIVQVAPIVSLVLGILTVVAALSAFMFSAGIGILPSTISVNTGAILGYGMFSLVVNGIVAFLYLSAANLLRSKSKTGWTYLFYVAAFYAIMNLITFNLAGLLGGLVTFYVLFQVREFYKK